MSTRLAIITTHPIQYNAPVFKLLSQRNVIKIKVFYTWGEAVLKDKYDPGFGKIILWDIPLLDGYEYTMMNNVSNNPGSHHFKGIINPTLINEIESWGATAVLIYGWSFNSHLKCMRYFKGKIPVYFRGDSNLLVEGGNTFKKWIRKYFLTWVYSYIDIAFYVGQANKRYFINNGLKCDQLIFAPHAIDNNRFSNFSNHSFRIDLGISSEKIVFLFAGKFESIKNPLLLMNAFLKIGNINSVLLFVGNGPLENELKNKWMQLNSEMKNCIHFLDFQNQTLMPDIYKTADVFVLPSQGETWGLSINEAMASSKAILVSDKCGAALDLVKDNQNGFVFESNNEKSLINKMELLIKQKEMLVDFGQCSFEIIRDWSFEKIALIIENYCLNSEIN